MAVVVFGASGDLASRKILPALLALEAQGALSRRSAVIGVARSPWTDSDFQALVRRIGLQSGLAGATSLANRCRYLAGDYDHSTTFEALEAKLTEVDAEFGTDQGRLFYLATSPAAFATVADGLARVGLNRSDRRSAPVRLVVEKPFGRDRASARELDDALHRSFSEEQIFRIDHYLGKETVQNVLALRFANSIFEPVWNRQYVDHVQITVAESLGIEHRAGFYESAGAMRDIVQNHVMQVLALTLMEPPASMDASAIRDEKVKALRAIEPLEYNRGRTRLVRGQYQAGWVQGTAVPGYREEPGVAADSTTETYVALRLDVDNWRWAGVPVYVRTGKRLPKRATEVAICFSKVPHLPFQGELASELRANTLVMRIQPDEGVTLLLGAKVPGQAFSVRTVAAEFSYGASFLEASPDAYERLLLDAMNGDPTLFIRADEVDQAWNLVDPALEAFANNSVPLEFYPAGSFGPAGAAAMISEDGRAWRNP
jgi:glucose-6-phosphate 1-dehydrogenase